MRPEHHEDNIGYKNPPKVTRFRKGLSGNPRGRPKRSRSGIPYDAVLGRKVLVRDDGIESYRTAAEAFLLHLTRKGLSGDGTATRSALDCIEAARASGMKGDHKPITTIVITGVAPGNPNSALLPLRMARKLKARSEEARIALEPWLVEAALARLSERQLSENEQLIVLQATRTPHKVRWPNWWVELP